MNKQTDIRIVELFAGVGGFRLGLETASPRFQTIWANQWEPGQPGQWAYKCYAENFRENPNCTNIDIAQVIDQVPEHDVLVGGFPCQDYSVAGTGTKGIEGKKGVLWWSIHEIVKRTQPKYIILENVDRLLKSPAKQRGRDFGIILRCLDDNGYTVEWRVINAADYGMPQRRRRVFLFAAHKSTVFGKKANQLDLENDGFKWLHNDGFFAPEFPVQPVMTKAPNISDLNDYQDLLAISDEFKTRFGNAGIMANGLVYTLDVTPETLPAKPLADLIETDGVDKHYILSEEKQRRFEYFKGSKKILRTDKKTGYQYTYSEGGIAYPDPLDRPARTMLTSEGITSRTTHVIKDPKTGLLRILTPLECERINGFPDNWTNTGMPERQRYFTMGNSLVVPIITKIGNRLLNL